MRLKDIFDRLPWIILIIFAFWLGCRLAKIREVSYPVVIVKKEKAEIPEPIIKWKDKIIWKESKPETVYYYETEILPVKAKEGMIALKYKPNNLQFWTKWIEADTTGMESMIKKYSYKNVYSEFVITYGKDGWFIKSKKDWFRKELYIGATYPDIVFGRVDLLFNRIIVSGRVTTKKAEVDLGWKF